MTETSRAPERSSDGSKPEQLCLFDHKFEMPAVESVDTVVYSSDRAIMVRRDGGRAVWVEARSFIRDLIFSILVAILIIVFVVQPVRVEGTSMLPHLQDGERIFVNKFIYSPLGKFFYQSNHIERGDIVVFWYPNDPDKSFIKRVIGLPGDTVSIREGIVYINGQPYQEQYLDETYRQRPENISATLVKNHYYFVMGDNRDSSNDSRQWGQVPEKYIYGKAIFRYWPLSSLGTIH